MQTRSSPRPITQPLAIETLDGDLDAIVASGQLGTVRGIGATLRRQSRHSCVTAGTPFLDDASDQGAERPASRCCVCRGLGPKKIKALHEQGISDLDALQKACEDGRVAALKGFGTKTQEKILGGLAFVAQAGQRVRLDHASQLAEAVLSALREVPGVVRLEACGSLRRRRETVGDIDVLCTSSDPAAVMDAFVTLPAVTQVLNRGDTLVSVMLGVGRRGAQIRGDLRVVTDEQFPYALHHFTGSQAHNVHLRTKWKEKGFKINEYGLTGPGGPIGCKTEADFFAALGLDYVPPELREDTGEIEAAAEHKLPRLVEVKDIRGVFHNHTTASDGGASLEEMVEAAQALGFQYLGIADHSQSLTIARGLTPERVRNQQDQIDRLNDSLDGFRVFKGTECDILPDGRLDFDNALLETFDYVVASVHSHFNLTREEMTGRIVRAVQHPMVTMLGHVTGRLLLSARAIKLTSTQCFTRPPQRGRWSRSTPSRHG